MICWFRALGIGGRTRQKVAGIWFPGGVSDGDFTLPFGGWLRRCLLPLFPAAVCPACFFVRCFGWDISKQKMAGIGTVRVGNKGHPCPVFPKSPIRGRFTLGIESSVKKHQPSKIMQKNSQSAFRRIPARAEGKCRAPLNNIAPLHPLHT